MFDIWGAIKMLATPVTSVVDGWQQRKNAKLESDLAIVKAQTEAKVELLKNSQKADIAWENTSLNQSGWKDEYWTIVLSIPMVLCFVPGLVKYVTSGFEALSHTPGWYQYALGIAIGSAFGVRQFANFMKLKKGD